MLQKWESFLTWFSRLFEFKETKMQFQTFLHINANVFLVAIWSKSSVHTHSKKLSLFTKLWQNNLGQFHHSGNITSLTHFRAKCHWKALKAFCKTGFYNKILICVAARENLSEVALATFWPKRSVPPWTLRNH